MTRAALLLLLAALLTACGGGDDDDTDAALGLRACYDPATAALRTCTGAGCCWPSLDITGGKHQ